MLRCSKRVMALKNDILRPTSHGKTRFEAKLKQFTRTFDDAFHQLCLLKEESSIAAMQKHGVRRQVLELSKTAPCADSETGEGWKR